MNIIEMMFYEEEQAAPICSRQSLSSLLQSCLWHLLGEIRNIDRALPFG